MTTEPTPGRTGEGARAADAVLLARLPRRQRIASGSGVVLVIAGLLYITFGLLSFEPGQLPDRASFDRPIARMADMFRGAQHAIDFIEPETPAERLLLQALDGNINLSAGVMVLMMRLFLGTLTLIAGLVALTVVVERERLLRIIRARDG